jgi:radical SAM superfamily enzyme
MKYGSGHQYKKSKYKYKRKAHENPKKEGYSKPFNDSLISKGGKGRKEEKCTYCHKGFHTESACMQKQIDQMSQIIQKKKTLEIASLRVPRRRIHKIIIPRKGILAML